MKEKGNALIIIIIILIFAYAIIVAMSGRTSEQNQEKQVDHPELLPKSEKVEYRSSYVPKCTKINYSDLIGDPEKNKDGDFTLTGEVVQITEKEKDIAEIKINVTPDTVLGKTTYKDTIYATYEYLRDNETRIKEKNIITIYGKSEGMYEYTDQNTGKIEILPKINVLFVDIEK